MTGLIGDDVIVVSGFSMFVFDLFALSAVCREIGTYAVQQVVSEVGASPNEPVFLVFGVGSFALAINPGTLECYLSRFVIGCPFAVEHGA